ncbi:MAG: DUF192 domain-containing protein [Patescibacteria group bacterium]
MTPKDLTDSLFWVFIFIVIIGLIIFSLFFKTTTSETAQQQESSLSFDKTKIKVKNIELEVEIADTPAKRARGLMFRTDLADNEGMIFIFPMAYKQSFWMANTKIPLDIVWINENMEIVHINANTPPCQKTGNLKAYCTTYKTDTAAKYVLEVNGGWMEKNNVQVGDRIEVLKNLSE